MLSSFPSELRKHGLHSDVRTILQLYTLMSRGVVRNLGGLYSCGEHVVVKDPRQKGPYTIAFFAHFLDIHISPGQTLDAAVMSSDVFNNWRQKHAPARISSPQLVDEFLEYVFAKSPDREGVAAAMEEQLARLLPKIDVPFARSDERVLDINTNHLDKDLAELLRKMREIAEKQKKAHSGGSKYIGTRGTSPYGHNGRSFGGIRVGGRSAHLSARMVLNDARYFPLDMNALLGDNNIDAALSALKGVAEKSSHLELDIEETIRVGAKRRGLFIPQLKTEDDDHFNIMLFIDNGGYSMDPYVYTVRTLFQKMKTRFSHDLRIYYFHNIINDVVYEDQGRVKDAVTVESLLKEGRHNSIFIVGDASMAPYELHGAWTGKSGFEYLCDMAAAFPRLAWLNPVSEGAWGYTETIDDIRTVVRMFALTPRGIEKAVRYLNQSSARKTEER